MKKKIYETLIALLMTTGAMAQIPSVTPLDVTRNMHSATSLSMDKALFVQATGLATNEEYVGYYGSSIIGLRLDETYDLASYYDEMLIGKYVGDKVTKIRVYLGAEVKTLTIWLRETLDAEPVFSQEIDVALLNTAGWVEAELPADKAYTITKTGYYVGYTATRYKVNANDNEYFPIAASVEGTLTKNTFLYSADGGANWGDYTMANANRGYIMVLEAQTAIVSNNHADVDLSLAYASGEARVIKRNPKTGKTMVSFQEYVFNAGKETVNNFKLEVSVPGMDVQPLSKKITVNGGGLPSFRGAVLDGYMEVPCNVNPSFKYKMKVSEINDNTVTDGYEANNEVFTEDMYFYDESSAKTPLLEMYTTVPCPNCPYGHKVIEALPEDCNPIVVAHHAGYYDDIYTIQGSRNYAEEFFIPGAPYATYNRIYLANSGGICSSLGYTNATQGAQVVVQALNEAEGVIPAFANISIASNYNETTRELTVTVSGEKTHPEMYDVLMKKSCVNVFITENGIEGNQGGFQGTYTHNHVIRAILGGLWGTEVTWNGNNYTAEFHTTIDQKWVADNLRIVAFLSDEDPNNGMYYHGVMNAAEVNLDGTSSIDEMNLTNLQIFAGEGTIRLDGEYDSYRIYNMQGMQVENAGLKHGIYLIRVESGKKSIVRKVVL